MAIEMKIYKEIRGYEAKAMFGFMWRQLAALAVMIFVGGAVFAGTTLVLLGAGQSLEQATNVAMYLLFPILIPAAAWGWWRPQGLKPEQYLGFFLRYHLMKRHIRYEDTLPTRRRRAPVRTWWRPRRICQARAQTARSGDPTTPERGHGASGSRTRPRPVASAGASRGPASITPVLPATRPPRSARATSSASRRCLPSGVAWLGEDEWSVTVRLSDINYVAASEGQQESIVDRWARYLNSFGHGTRVQETIINRVLDDADVAELVQKPPRATPSTSTAMISTASSARNSRQRAGTR